MNSELAASFVKRYGDEVTIEANLRLPVDRFSITVLFGPSGCGKTTTLRGLAGLERPEQGRITFGSHVWFDAARKTFLSPQSRDVGFLFQDYALFPHLNVAGNVAYGLSSISGAERRRRIAEVLKLVGLSNLAERYPNQLSGGEQQRVALARTLVRRPKLLLLDEPLSALDNPIREQLRPELRRVLVEFAIPVIVVTHDRIEALALADHLVVMDRGKTVQQGTPIEVFNRPANVEVAHIVGVETVLPGRVAKVENGLATVIVGSVALTAVAGHSESQEVYVCLRGEDVSLEQGVAGVHSARNRLPAVVQSLHLEGPMVRVGLDCGFRLTALITRPACDELALRNGSAITAVIKAPAVHLIDRRDETSAEVTGSGNSA